MASGIYLLLSEPVRVIPFALETVQEMMPNFCLNTWASARLDTELAALLTVEFTPESLSEETLKQLRFTFWEYRSRDGRRPEGYPNTVFNLQVDLIQPHRGYSDNREMTLMEYMEQTSTIGDILLIEDEMIGGKIKDVREHWTRRPRPTPLTAIERFIEENKPKVDLHPLATALASMIKVMTCPGGITFPTRHLRIKEGEYEQVKTTMYSRSLPDRFVEIWELPDDDAKFGITFHKTASDYTTEGYSILDLQKPADDILKFLFYSVDIK